MQHFSLVWVRNASPEHAFLYLDAHLSIHRFRFFQYSLEGHLTPLVVWKVGKCFNKLLKINLWIVCGSYSLPSLFKPLFQYLLLPLVQFIFRWWACCDRRYKWQLHLRPGFVCASSTETFNSQTCWELITKLSTKLLLFFLFRILGFLSHLFLFFSLWFWFFRLSLFFLFLSYISSTGFIQLIDLLVHCLNLALKFFSKMTFIDGIIASKARIPDDRPNIITGVAIVLYDTTVVWAPIIHITKLRRCLWTGCFWGLLKRDLVEDGWPAHHINCIVEVLFWVVDMKE